MLDTSSQQTCTTCYRISCKKCDWVASDAEVLLIQQQKLTACPLCGWKPEEE